MDSSHSEELDDFPDFTEAVASIPDHIDEGFGAAAGQGSGSEAPETELIDLGLIKQALGPSFRTVFKAIATKRGPHWRLDDFEEDALVKGWSPILQLMLAKLGNQEQVLFSVALISTTAIVGGKVAQDAMKQASSKANTRTAPSGGSSASSASAEVARVTEAESLYDTADDA